jgi:shikimate dehydrogenase
MSISPATKLTAIIGDPVTHSLSPLLHNKVYENEEVDAVMLAFGHPSIEKLIVAMRVLPIHLAAVTMPHKQTIMSLLDDIDKTAHDIGAVNTVINREGKLHGFNTDVVGIATALKDVTLTGANALLIGAGGAARTVAYHLKQEEAHIFCSNRDRSQAEALMSAFGGTFIDSRDFGEQPFDVVVNATPVGMNPNAGVSPFPAEHLRPEMAVFDLVYSPLETKLLVDAKACGARTISGLTMFLAQGIEQERLWLGKTVDSAPYLKLLEEHIRGENA